MGGGGSTTTSGVSKDIWDAGGKKVFGDVTKQYMDTRNKPGDLVAGLDPSQKEALKAQETQGRQMMAGEGLYDLSGFAQRDLQNTLGGLQGQASMGGTFGSARSQAATNKALLDKSGDWLSRRQELANAGGKMLGEAGTTRRDYAQQRLDAPHTAASRYFGYLGSAPQEQTTSGGGTHCCTAAQSEGHMTFTEVKKLRAWHRKQPMIWQEGYDVWGKVVADNWIIGRSKWSSDRVRDFYNHRIYGKRTIGSVYADIVIIPLSYLIGIYKVLKKRFNFEKILSENAGVKE